MSDVEELRPMPAEARAEVTRLRNALSDAVELAMEGWSYAEDHFKTKWEYAKRLDAIRAHLPREGHGP